MNQNDNIHNCYYSMICVLYVFNDLCVCFVLRQLSLLVLFDYVCIEHMIIIIIIIMKNYCFNATLKHSNGALFLVDLQDRKIIFGFNLYEIIENQQQVTVQRDLVRRINNNTPKCNANNL